MVNYVRLAATAERLINENGRSLTIERLSQTPDNVSKPWRGAAEPRVTPIDSIDVTGVYIEPASLARYGFTQRQIDQLRESHEVVMISGNSVDGAELEKYDEIIDNGIRWHIDRVTRLGPGDLVMLYVMGLTR